MVDNEKVGCLSICPKSKHIILAAYTVDEAMSVIDSQLVDLEPEKFSKLLVFEYSPSSLQLKSTLQIAQVPGEPTAAIFCGEIYGYYGNHCVFVGLTCSLLAPQMVAFEYDEQSSKTSEITSMRASVKFLEPRKMIRVGKSLFTSDKNNKLLKIQLSF